MEKNFTITTANDDRARSGKNKGRQMINEKHNQRMPEAVQKANQRDIINRLNPHIDTSRTQFNKSYVNMTVYEAYEHLFGENIERYNFNCRKNRRTSVEKEIDKIDNTYLHPDETRKKTQKQELRYEMIVQVGNEENRPPENECVEILEKFLAEWNRKFPNLFIYNCTLHMDEATPHLHINYIPFAHRKNGIGIGNGLTKAFEEMGYNNQTVRSDKIGRDGNYELDENGNVKQIDVKDYENGAKSQWIADVNRTLEDIVISYGYGVSHPQKGKKVEHQSQEEYKKKQMIEQSEHLQAELVNITEAVNKKHKEHSEYEEAIYCDKQERYNLAREISELENRKNENRQIISAQEDKIMESDEIISAKNNEIMLKNEEKEIAESELDGAYQHLRNVYEEIDKAEVLRTKLINWAKNYKNICRVKIIDQQLVSETNNYYKKLKGNLYDTQSEEKFNYGYEQFRRYMIENESYDEMEDRGI